MTDSSDPTSTPEPLDFLGEEHRSSESSVRAARGRRLGVVAGGALAAVAVAGAGAWGVAQLLGGGTSPAGAVPADALAYVALDLDPSAGQKLEALKTLRKFPALRDDLGLGSADDLRSWLFDVVRDDTPCAGVSFADDVEPWLGDRVAVSVVPGDDEPVPFVVLQVTDQDAARAGVSALESCADRGSTDGSGVAFTGDYMVVAETDAQATGVVADVADGSLADDADYQRWVGEAGGAGILTGYVAPDGPAALADAFAASTGPSGHGLDLGATPFGRGPDLSMMSEQLEDFGGAAMVVRFADSSLELEVASTRLGSPEATGAAAQGDGGLAELPASTAVGLGLAVSDTAAQDLLDGIQSGLDDLPGQGGVGVDSMLAQLESASGLTFPDDLQALLGDGVAVAVDSSLDLGSLHGGADGAAPDLTSLPAGIRISGDPATIMPVLDRMRAQVGPFADLVVTEAGDHAVAIGLDPDYTATLAGDGGLGDVDAFAAALPDLSASAGGLFVNLDAGDWLAALTEGDGDPAGDQAGDQAQLRQNLEPLEALGVTGSAADGVSHIRLRLTTN